MKTKPIRKINNFLNIAKSRRHGERNMLLILMGIYTGLRISELLSLNIEDIKVNGEIVESLIIKGKGKKTRHIPLSRALQEILMKNLKEDDKGALFKSQKGRRLSRFQVYGMMQKIAQETSQSNIATHSMRKTFAQSLLDNGVDIETMRALLGHSSIAITQKYIETDEKKLFSAINTLNYNL